MRPRPLAATLLAPLTLAGALAAACASGGAKKRGPAPDDSATLEVTSNYTSPVDVFAIRDNGLRVRLASNVGSRPQRVRLGPSLIGGAGALRIVAVPLAERNLASTGSIVVRPGDVVQFTVAANLNASTVYIR